MTLRVAERLFKRLLRCRNDVGLLSEEYDPRTRRMLGNFPQAFSHVALANSALNLMHASRKGRQPKPVPHEPKRRGIDVGGVITRALTAAGLMK